MLKFMLMPTGSLSKETFNFEPVSAGCKCVKIVDLCSDFISFADDSRNFHRIGAKYTPFWGYDIFAEILADYYDGYGLNINISRRQEYFEEAKSLIHPHDFIRFCNNNKNRWQPEQYQDAFLNLNNSIN